MIPRGSVAGNGPSAITLSYFLSGNWPYFNGLHHPIDFLTYRLYENKEKSLIEQDLDYLSEGLEGRSLNPVSVLYDTLTHPQADLGMETPSVIQWKYDPLKTIDHIVIGKGLPGGSWQKMDNSALTLSHSSWMELPNLDIQHWDIRKSVQSRLKQKRATVGTVAEYYNSYVDSQGLSRYFLNKSKVTSITPIDPAVTKNFGFNHLWNIKGHALDSDSQTNVKTFNYITPHVILATGNSDQPNKLNIIGENLPFVMHSSSKLEALIQKKSAYISKILIVGAGLSAADAVITARFYGIPTIHVFRRSISDPELIFNKLPQDIYPEYHKVYQMMKDSDLGHYEGYKAYSCSKVQEIKPDGTVTIISYQNGDLIKSEVNISHVLVLIGRHPDLSFLPNQEFKVGVNPNKPVDCKKNPVDIKLHNHESVFYPNIFAVGPLVGDNFVRFAQGGCLAVASHIYKDKYHNL